MTTDIAASRGDDIPAIAAHHFPGVVIQKNLCDAIHAWLINHDAVSDADVPLILTAANNLGPPAYATELPTPAISLRRFPINNPAPDGWSIVDDGTFVPGGNL